MGVIWGDLNLHCLSLNMWISIKNPDQVIWLAGNYKWGWHLNLFSMSRVKIYPFSEVCKSNCYRVVSLKMYQFPLKRCCTILLFSYLSYFPTMLNPLLGLLPCECYAGLRKINFEDLHTDLHTKPPPSTHTHTHTHTHTQSNSLLTVPRRYFHCGTFY